MKQTPRDSNIELLRIVFMLMIILHHYCVNAGFGQVFDFANNTFNTLLVQCMSFGGKVGVSGFFAISGYFMIRSEYKRSKAVKLIFTVLFYNIAVVVFLSLMGYAYSSGRLTHDLIPLLFGFSDSFIASYLLVYILSPVINKFLGTITKREFHLILGVLLFYFTILSTFFSEPTWNYFGWAFTMYCVGAYIRIYPIGVLDTRKYQWLGIGLSLFVMWGCVVVMNLLSARHADGKFADSWMFLMSNANKLPVLTLAVSMVLLFKNMTLGYHRYINIFAASTLGVFCLHANSDMMRTWLWTDFLKNATYIESPYLWLHMLGSVVAVYVVCVLIDIGRLHFVEKPIFRTKLRSMYLSNK